MSNDGTETAGRPTSGENNRETYDSFMAITKWAVISVATLLILLAIFLVR